MAQVVITTVVLEGRSRSEVAQAGPSQADRARTRSAAPAQPRPVQPDRSRAISRNRDSPHQVPNSFARVGGRDRVQTVIAAHESGFIVAES
jgi:hypothetical protein